MHSKRTLSILTVFGLIFACLLFLASGRRQQPDMITVTGTALDPLSGTPLPGIEVSWKSERVTTGKTGQYQIELPAGVRELSFSAPDRKTVKKLLVIRQVGPPLRQDVLLPETSARAPRLVLALDRGSRVSSQGRDLISDVSAGSTISLADEYGNSDHLLNLDAGSYRVHSPVWLNGGAIAYAKEGVFHNPENEKAMGIFEYQLDSARIQQVAAGIGAQFLSKSPHGSALAIAGHKEVYVLGSAASPVTPHRIFALEPDRGFLLSVNWALDDRIYLTIDDSIPVDDRHFLTRSRIASLKPDGTDVKPGWASDPEYSFRYPVNAGSADIIFCRFTLNGAGQALWSRSLRTGKIRPLAESALRAVYMDPGTDHLYYIYRQDLRLRDLKSGSDWVIVNSVTEAAYLQ